MKTTKPMILFLFMFICFTTVVLSAQQSAVDKKIIDTHAQSLANWQAMRFGLFIHWGPVSLQGTEIGWSRAGERRGYKYGPGTEVAVDIYDNLYKTFNPTLFNAQEWATIALEAGVKYLVFTSRHHDGFSMFDTKASDYKITSPLSPFRRDVVAELAAACHTSELGFGLYYSQPDWHHPDAFTPDRHGRYLEYLQTQVRELVSNYGRLDILWFDGLDRTAADFNAVELNKLARRMQPNLIINNRNGLIEDFDTPEQTIGKFQMERPWESCITICRQWAWKPNDQLKTLAECLRTLIYCAGGDGNLLLNVGPMPDGRIEPRQVERLREMGSWLKKYGQGIYGTRGGPYKPGSWGAATRKGNTVYLFIVQWPQQGPLVLPALPGKIVDAQVLTGGKVKVRTKARTLQLDIAKKDQQEIATVIKLELADNALVITPCEVNEIK